MSLDHNATEILAKLDQILCELRAMNADVPDLTDVESLLSSIQWDTSTIQAYIHQAYRERQPGEGA